ncbi:MAG: histidine phosphatase family protein [Solobacterium sp.]|nr:histidine phosphatase family protein [Solobacterium sp.]
MIYIIRHGQTAMNHSHVLQGRSDLPLNEKGIRQAESAGEWLASQGIVFDRIYSSPLQRAVQTAELAVPGIPVTIDDRLIEMDYGPYEGTDLKSLTPELVLFFSDFVNNPAPEGMEQLSDVVRRCGAFLEDIKDLHGNLLISTHAIAMKGLLEYLTPDSHGSYWSKYIGNCSVYAADVIDGQYTVPQEVYFQHI